jgi:hypothetical protein
MARAKAVFAFIDQDSGYLRSCAGGDQDNHCLFISSAESPSV